MKIITILLVLLAFSIPAAAQTPSSAALSPKTAFVVNHNGDTNDQTPGNGVCADAAGNCTLRAAIEEANSLPDSDTITFDLALPNTISLTLGRIIITGDINIVGPGARNLVVQRSTAAGTASFRILTFVKLNSLIPHITANVSGLTIANGENLNTSGGGISNGSDCIVNLTEVSVTNNRAVDSQGGGIVNFGLLTINRSTVRNNTASQGGGISNQPAGTVRIYNSTISGNSAVGVPANNVIAAAGALNNFNQAVLINVTITNNTSTQFSAGVSTTGVVSLRNTIIAKNISPVSPDASGNFTSLGNNVIGTNMGSVTSFPTGNPNVSGDKVGETNAEINPLLTPLQNNGGQTDTHALLAGSPAIDFANYCVVDNSCSSDNPSFPLQTDQRGDGFLRQVGMNVDSGAFEANNLIRSNRPAFDFDGDGKADLSVFRPENGTWYLQQSTSGFTGIGFGFPTDKLVPADYDGDGKTDVAVYRGGTWYLQRSSLGLTGIQFGDGSDVPLPADYDGDGKAELAVFRPSNGYWYILNITNNQFTAVPFGQNGDKPVPADYDGDGKTDIAVNRNGNWYIQRSQLGFTGVLFGDANDKTVPADYDGDGKADIAVFRPSNGTWYLLQSQAGFIGLAFGLGTDIPVAADYDGDGKVDIAVVRNGNWYLNRSTQGFTGIQFGTPTDLPIPNAFVR